MIIFLWELLNCPSPRRLLRRAEEQLGADKAAIETPIG